MPPKVVFTPLEWFTAPLDKAPLTGIDPTKDEAMLHRPNASISWVLSTGFPSAVTWGIARWSNVDFKWAITYRKLWLARCFPRWRAKGRPRRPILMLRSCRWSSELCYRLAWKTLVGILLEGQVLQILKCYVVKMCIYIYNKLYFNNEMKIKVDYYLEHEMTN